MQGIRNFGCFSSKIQRKFKVKILDPNLHFRGFLKILFSAKWTLFPDRVTYYSGRMNKDTFKILFSRAIYLKQSCEKTVLMSTNDNEVEYNSRQFQFPKKVGMLKKLIRTLLNDYRQR